MLSFKGLWRALVVALWLGGTATGTAAAHDLPYAVITISTSEAGETELIVRTHVPALLTGRPIAHLNDSDLAGFLSLEDSGLDRLKARAADALRAGFYIRADGRDLVPRTIVFPDNVTLRRDARIRPSDPQPSAPIRIVLGNLHADTLEIGPPYALGRTLIMLSDQAAAPDAGSVVGFLGPGEGSGPVSLSRRMSVGRTFATFFTQGVLHIVPLGLDHILFVITLAVVSTNTRLLVLQISAFTIAHTVTLALATFDMAPAPAGVIEPLIALSIAAMAVDNIRTANTPSWRPYAVSAFGLLHGFGFAGALRELGLPQGQELAALVAFNLGVEAGQLLVVAALLAVVGWWMRRSWYRVGIVLPVSVAIAATGVAWTLERTGIAPWT